MKNYLLIITLLSVQLLHAQAIFQHTTMASNISNRYMTTLTHPLLDNQADALAFITPHRNFGNRNERNDAYSKNYGVWYNAMTQKWVIFTQDTSAMTQDMTFNVLVAPRNNSNYFTHKATPQSRLEGGFNHSTAIDNPITNGKISAILIVTHNGGTGSKPSLNNNSLLVGYGSNGKWIIGHNGYLANYLGLSASEQSFMKDDMMFNVMVVDAQACTKDNLVTGFSDASAFLHTADACTNHNIGASGFSTYFDHAKTNNNPNSVVFVTPNWGWSSWLIPTCSEQTVGPYNESPVCVQYGRVGNGGWFAEGKWSIQNGAATLLAQGTKFNVVIINPTKSGLEDSEKAQVAHIEQNSPNPFQKETIIPYFVPENSQTAQIVVYNSIGSIVKVLKIQTFGQGKIALQMNDLIATGYYNYALFVDGKQVNAKLMLLIK
ncbi:MAG: hypothetical protein RLZZ628_1575 [Bacteroidota bacterium]|jgi:hypothetical protein